MPTTTPKERHAANESNYEANHGSSTNLQHQSIRCHREFALAGGMRLAKWCKIVGIGRSTAWRWRKAGKLEVVIRYGHAYVTRRAIEEFFTNDGSSTRRVPRTDEQLLNE